MVGFKNLLRMAGYYILAFFFPPFCACCNKSVKANEILCQDCVKELDSLCIKEPNIRTYNKRQYRLHAVYQYSEDNAASAVVKRVKFMRRITGTRFMGAQIAEKVNKMGKQFDIITYVPMHWFDETKRTFNQCEYICHIASKLLGIKERTCLKKTRRTLSQHDLSVAERRTNLIGAFRAKRFVKDKRILLLDDVTTSGSTMCECAQELYRMGARSVTLVAFSMVKRNH